MHEGSLVASLLRQVAELAAAQGKVEQIRLQVGALAGVEPLLLSEAFLRQRTGTIAALAELVIDAVGLTCVCGRCQLTFSTDDFRAACPTCGLPAEVIAGDEVILESIAVRTLADSSQTS